MNLTERVKTAIKTRSNFSLTYDSVLTADFGDIVPICCKELVPTDKITAQGQVFMRLAPLAVPTFGRIHGFVNHFFVPTRILMPEYAFEDSITGGTDGSAPESFPFITLRALFQVYDNLGVDFGEVPAKRLCKFLSYLGLSKIARQLNEGAGDEWEDQDYDNVDYSISLLPIIAFSRIYGDYYFPYGLEEDELVRNVLHKKWSGLITSETLSPELMIQLEYLFKFATACYTKDYFTSALTRPQRGAASIVPVDAATSTDNVGFAPSTGSIQKGSSGNYGLGASGSSATGANTIIGRFEAHAMRWAQQVQAFLERNNIAGGRYFEQMLARFGVHLKAEQLQRSVYLGGSDFWVNVSDVTSTMPNIGSAGISPTASGGYTQPNNQGLGAQAGKGIALGKETVSYTADEYGFFITLMHFVPETGYVDGIDRMWSRHSRFDYWTPELEDTGMQPIYNKELNGGTLTYHSSPNGVFGYVPRYSEYKFSNPILGGDYVLGNGVFSDSLMDSYHLYRRFVDDEIPVLNTDFVRVLPSDSDAPGVGHFERIFQNTGTDYDHFLVNVQMSIGANRPMIGFAESGMEFANNSGSGDVNVAYGGVRL